MSYPARQLETRRDGDVQLPIVIILAQIVMTGGHFVAYGVVKNAFQSITVSKKSNTVCFIGAIYKCVFSLQIIHMRDI